MVFSRRREPFFQSNRIPRTLFYSKNFTNDPIRYYQDEVYVYKVVPLFLSTVRLAVEESTTKVDLRGMKRDSVAIDSRSFPWYQTNIICDSKRCRIPDTLILDK